MAIDRYAGSHTSESIAAQFESLMEMYELHDKIDYIITGNAANMKKYSLYAFQNSTIVQLQQL